MNRLHEELSSKGVDMDRYIAQAAKDAEEIQELRSSIGNLEEQLHRMLKVYFFIFVSHYSYTKKNPHYLGIFNFLSSLSLKI